MGLFIFALLVLAGAALYFMNADERRRLLQTVVARLQDGAQKARTGPLIHDPLHELLIERSRRLIVTPALIGICVFIWLMTLAGGDTALVDWGANYAPQTTNGGWVRLLGYTFVHGSLLHLLATVAALFPLGIVLERMVGRITFAGVYVVAGMVAGTASLWLLPATTVTYGASGAVFGLIGLLLAVIFYGYASAPRMPLSQIAVNRIAVGCGVFLLYNLVTDALGTTAEMMGFFTGLALGLVVARGVREEQPPPLRAGIVSASAMVITLVLALSFSGTIDARPELARIREVESRTALEYAQAVDSFTRGRMSAKALADVIQLKVLPDLKADRQRVEKLHGVPREQTRLVSAAQTYFDMREASWQRRIQGLLASNMKILRDADRSERAALDLFDRLQQEIAALPES